MRHAPRPVGRVFLLCFLVLAFLGGCGGSAASRGADPGQAGGAAPPAAAAERSVLPSTGTGSAPEAAPAPAGQASEAGALEAPPQQAAAPKAAAPGKPNAAARVSTGLRAGYAPPPAGDVAECWQPLVAKLQNDPKASSEVIQYFCSLPPYSPQPMGEKVKELFTNAFLRKRRAPDDGKPKPPPSRIYRNVVTATNVQKCNDFLERNKTVFDAVEKKYPVPREVLVALLLVETRLGTYVGKENAFWSLACMAAADSPERMEGGLSGIPITYKHADWLQSKLTDKSNWAYRELCALLAFCATQRLDPHGMPGSVYGAIGICQFMPSNIDAYGDDGDGDGVIDLFSEPDAIYSAARYLTRHGWKSDMSVAQQRGVLKRYNNLTVYANTILALGESVRMGVLQTGPPDSVKVARASKNAKGATKKSGAKKK